MDRHPLNKTVTIDLTASAFADVSADACAAAADGTALPAAHPRSLLDLPPGEARQSLLVVHGILDLKLPPMSGAAIITWSCESAER